MTKLPLKSMALAACLAATSAEANLLTNGSFEDGTFAPRSNQTMTLAPGATTITGWTVFNDALAWIGAGNPWGLTAYEGVKFLDLTDYSFGGSFGGVQQTITTIPGATYLLTFNLGSANQWGRPSAITSSAAGTSATFTSPTTGTTNDWQAASMSFVATAAATTISLVGSTGQNYIGLDNASVVLTAVPEPSTAVLLLAGVVAVGWVARRGAR